LANIFENKDRRVVPNWRSFRKTAFLGELHSLNHAKAEGGKAIISIDDYIEGWATFRTTAFAGDLISAGLTNGFIKNESVQDAAKFILKASKQSTETQKILASLVLDGEQPTNLLGKLKNISTDDIDSWVNPDIIRNKIISIKKIINNYQFSPILYVELARNYLILGQLQKALNAMKIALHLAPDNRFVLRCAARLFAHSGDFEFAHDIVRKSKLANVDPWIMSTEIALATIRDRTSRFIKKGIEIVNSKNIDPFNFTELASSLGTVEFINGNNNRSKKLFHSSLISPNDNSLAQAEWASSKDLSLNFEPSDYNVRQNYEALALEHFGNREFEEALNNAFNWFLDMPFSKRPVMLGSHIASTFMNDSEKARNFLKAGLLSHPNDPQILNNIVYSLALDNQIPEAMTYLNRINESQNIAPVTKICIMATRGLIYFRSGLIDLGRQFYLDSIAEAKAINNRYFNWLAILNYAREEILINSEYVDTTMQFVHQIPNESIDVDIDILKKEVLELYAKVKS
jgi:tetratricopeptide (TPR) repeat protein